jgi:predicted ATPase/DNA-binding XRE family transcriptional regulator
MTELGDLAQLVRRFRSDARISQEALAERAGLSARTVSDLECGVARSPRAMTLTLLAEALGLSLADRERLRLAGRSTSENVDAAGVRAQLPQVHLVGRDRDLSQARRLLVEDGVRILTIVGGAGVGKTALAFGVARDIADTYDNVLLVELAALSSPDLVPSKVAQAASHRAARTDTIAASLAAAFAGRRTLLVLDNFEHVMGAAPFVADLVGAAPELTILITSRTPLRLSLERELVLSPVELPTGDPVADNAAQQSAAVALLLEHARVAQPGFAVTTANARSIAQLARLLEGVPLAIELAAPLLAILSPAALVARLEQRLPMLQATRDDQPARHRTMRDAIQWSYELLSPAERRAFRACAVFRGTFTAQAAQSVIAVDASGTEILAALRLLASLVAHSLLRVVHAEDELHFEYSAFVREYALDLLQESGESDDAHLKLMQHCLDVASLVGLRDAGSQTRENLDRLTTENPTFDAALTWATGSGKVALGLRLAVKLWPYWWMRGASYEGLRHLSALLASANEQAEGLDDDLLANAYSAATGLAEACGMFERREQFFAEALVRKRRLGDEPGIATLLGGAGAAASQLGDYDAARALLEEAVGIRRRLGTAFELAKALADLGQNASNAGDDLEAASALEESLRRFRGAESNVGIAMVFLLLAVVATRAHDLERAETFSREARDVATSAGHTVTVALATATLGRVALERGQLDEAHAALHEAFALLQSSSDLSDMPELVECLAALEHARRNDRAAARLLGAAAQERAHRRTPVVAAESDQHSRLTSEVRTALGAEFDSEFTVGSAYGIHRTLTGEGLR